MNDDLAQCDVLGASWQAWYEACQGPKDLFCSLSISDPLAREDLSKRGWAHAWRCLISLVLLCFHFHPSGSRTNQSLDDTWIALLQGIFPTQESNPGLLHYWWILYHLSYQGSPDYNWTFFFFFNPRKDRDSP